MERTGHPSLESVRSYKRTSDLQRKAVSDILNSKRPCTEGNSVCLHTHPSTSQTEVQLPLSSNTTNMQANIQNTCQENSTLIRVHQSLSIITHNKYIITPALKRVYILNMKKQSITRAGASGATGAAMATALFSQSFSQSMRARAQCCLDCMHGQEESITIFVCGTIVLATVTNLPTKKTRRMLCAL